jgi:hypothetical protein
MTNKPVLSDKDLYPSDKVIFSHIGRLKSAWISFFEMISSEYPDFTRTWKYYNDGKRWLLKVARKTKTVFWLSVREKLFTTTFYFTDRATAMIGESGIPEELKAQFADGRQYGKIRGLTVAFAGKKEIPFARALIEVKLKVK